MGLGEAFSDEADHPFMLFVIDNRSKAIFFMGRYMKIFASIHSKWIVLNLSMSSETKKEMQKYAPGDYDGAIIITMKKEKKNIRNFFKRKKE